MADRAYALWTSQEAEGGGIVVIKGEKGQISDPKVGGGHLSWEFPTPHPLSFTTVLKTVYFIENINKQLISIYLLGV